MGQAQGQGGGGAPCSQLKPLARGCWAAGGRLLRLAAQPLGEIGEIGEEIREVRGQGRSPLECGVRPRPAPVLGETSRGGPGRAAELWRRQAASLNSFEPVGTPARPCRERHGGVMQKNADLAVVVLAVAESVLHLHLRACRTHV